MSQRHSKKGAPAWTNTPPAGTMARSTDDPRPHASDATAGGGSSSSSSSSSLESDMHAGLDSDSCSEDDSSRTTGDDGDEAWARAPPEWDKLRHIEHDNGSSSSSSNNNDNDNEERHKTPPNDSLARIKREPTTNSQSPAELSRHVFRTLETVQVLDGRTWHAAKVVQDSGDGGTVLIQWDWTRKKERVERHRVRSFVNITTTSPARDGRRRIRLQRHEINLWSGARLKRNPDKTSKKIAAVGPKKLPPKRRKPATNARKRQSTETNFTKTSTLTGNNSAAQGTPVVVKPPNSFHFDSTDESDSKGRHAARPLAATEAVARMPTFARWHDTSCDTEGKRAPRKPPPPVANPSRLMRLEPYDSARLVPPIQRHTFQVNEKVKAVDGPKSFPTDAIVVETIDDTMLLVRWEATREIQKMDTSQVFPIVNLLRDDDNHHRHSRRDRQKPNTFASEFLNKPINGDDTAVSEDRDDRHDSKSHARKTASAPGTKNLVPRTKAAARKPKPVLATKKSSDDRHQTRDPRIKRMAHKSAGGSSPHLLSPEPCKREGQPQYSGKMPRTDKNESQSSSCDSDDSSAMSQRSARQRRLSRNAVVQPTLRLCMDKPEISSNQSGEALGMMEHSSAQSSTQKEAKHRFAPALQLRRHFRVNEKVQVREGPKAMPMDATVVEILNDDSIMIRWELTRQFQKVDTVNVFSVIDSIHEEPGQSHGRRRGTSARVQTNTFASEFVDVLGKLDVDEKDLVAQRHDGKTTKRKRGRPRKTVTVEQFSNARKPTGKCKDDGYNEKMEFIVHSDQELTPLDHDVKARGIGMSFDDSSKGYDSELTFEYTSYEMDPLHRNCHTFNSLQEFIGDEQRELASSLPPSPVNYDSRPRPVAAVASLSPQFGVPPSVQSAHSVPAGFSDVSSQGSSSSEGPLFEWMDGQRRGGGRASAETADPGELADVLADLAPASPLKKSGTGRL